MRRIKLWNKLNKGCMRLSNKSKTLSIRIINSKLNWVMFKVNWRALNQDNNNILNWFNKKGKTFQGSGLRKIKNSDRRLKSLRGIRLYSVRSCNKERLRLVSKDSNYPINNRKSIIKKRRSVMLKGWKTKLNKKSNTSRTKWSKLIQRLRMQEINADKSKRK